MLLSCGVILMNPRRHILACHATGTSRWDLPKGLAESGEAPLATAVRETWEETSLRLDPTAIVDLGEHAYLPGKRLHLFALHVAEDAFDPADCRCHSTFPHRHTGEPTLEVDGHAWQPIDALDEWCGKNMRRVLGAIDWPAIAALPLQARLAVEPAFMPPARG